VIAGLWLQKETKDGTYSLWDLWDVHEILDVKEANEVAYQYYRESLEK
jgi:hypothetical protein